MFLCEVKMYEFFPGRIIKCFDFLQRTKMSVQAAQHSLNDLAFHPFAQSFANPGFLLQLYFKFSINNMGRITICPIDDTAKCTRDNAGFINKTLDSH